ncbi:hypothetical protein GQ457_02G026670 [Hibiscus cannabinus]
MKSGTAFLIGFVPPDTFLVTTRVIQPVLLGFWLYSSVPQGPPVMTNPSSVHDMRDRFPESSQVPTIPTLCHPVLRPPTVRAPHRRHRSVPRRLVNPETPTTRGTGDPNTVEKLPKLWQETHLRSPLIRAA